MLRLAALAASLGLARAAWTDGDNGVDHMYSDISSFAMKGNSTAECAAACATAAPYCVGWVMGGWPGCDATNATTCYLKSAMGAAVANPCRISGYMPSVLSQLAFATTPVGAVAPAGWLHDELALQASGLTGHLAFFWADIQSSSWIGGAADGGLHERTPYWLNGLVPLTYLLPTDANLTALRTSYLQYIMEHQAASGWIGLDDAPADGNQYWGRFNVVLSLLQHYEASGDADAITCIFRFLAEARRRMETVPLAGWAQARGQDFIWGMQMLVDSFDSLKGVPAGFSQAWLIDFMDATHLQMVTPAGNDGGDWKSWYDTDEFPTTAACVPGAPCNMLTHGESPRGAAMQARPCAPSTNASF